MCMDLCLLLSKFSLNSSTKIRVISSQISDWRFIVWGLQIRMGSSCHSGHGRGHGGGGDGGGRNGSGSGSGFGSRSRSRSGGEFHTFDIGHSKELWAGSRHKGCPLVGFCSDRGCCLHQSWPSCDGHSRRHLDLSQIHASFLDHVVCPNNCCQNQSVFRWSSHLFFAFWILFHLKLLWNRFEKRWNFWHQPSRLGQAFSFACEINGGLVAGEILKPPDCKSE